MRSQMSSARMKLVMRGTALATAIGVVGALVACSVSPDADVPPAEPGDQVKIPEADGGEPDAAPDVDVDAGDGGDGPAKTCSAEDFCHTAVPPEQTLRAGWSDASGIAWAVSKEGAILRWDGAAWSVHASGLGELVSIWGSGPTDIWVGTTNGILHGEGASSAALTFAAVATLPGDETPISSIWGTGPNDVWATGPAPEPGYRGRVLHYAGAAAGWELDAASSEPIQYARVWGSATSGVWLTGTRNNPKNIAELAVRRRPVGASDFSDVALPGDPAYQADNPYAKLNKVWAVSASVDGTMWIVGEQAFDRPGYVRGVTNDGGQTYQWSYTALSQKSLLLPNAIWGINANDAWIGGDFGRLTHWDGNRWKQAFITITKYPVVQPFHAVWGNGTDDLWVVGAGIAMHRDLKK